MLLLNLDIYMWLHTRNENGNNSTRNLMYWYIYKVIQEISDVV